MELHIHESKAMRCIDEKTKWCCEKFKKWGEEVGDIIEDVGYGIPPVVFNWRDGNFQTTEKSLLMGMGGFGDTLQGNIVEECPFCKHNLSKITFVINNKKRK